VLAVAAPHAALVEQEIAAAFAGAGIPVAPVAPQAIHDASVLRVGPLRTLYQRDRLRHAPGLEALASAVHGWTPDVRSPRVEALVAAVTRLVACYPWIGAEVEQEPMRGPKPIDAIYLGGKAYDPGMDMVYRGGR
jgi:hypothetical protein